MDSNRPIIAAVDGSDESMEALRWAAHVAAGSNRALLVVSVVGLAVSGRPTTSIDAQARLLLAMRTAAERAVDRGVRIAADTAPAVRVTGEVLEGYPALALRGISARAHLMVLGRRGLGGVKGLLLGSVSTDVAAHAECPVVLVSGPMPNEGEVVVGIDTSPLAREAARLGFAMADALGASVRAVHAYGTVPERVLDDSGTYEELLRTQAEELISEQCAGLRADYPDLTFTSQVAAQTPSRLLVDAARDARLVVLGSRGRGGFRGLLLGSTGQAVAQVARCPVMIVHG
ncbi:MAG: universal stress protein [Gordonia sp. (in: high G+C Gram-positive bacteria)]|uniref:universal stress protein n=1 Tax=Gordonia sp. (in: high G+C Gram-positive bacteria) TaxID=84139 RepID=UPI003C733E73